jgi:hypothetical protein
VEFDHSEKYSNEAITEVLNELETLYETAAHHQDTNLLGPGGFKAMHECFG